MMQTSTVVFTALLLAVSAVPEQPAVQCIEDSASGKTCLSTSTAQDVLAMDDTEGAEVSLLQVAAAAREDKTQSNATQGQSQKDISDSVAEVKEVVLTNASSIGFAHMNTSSKAVAHMNKSSQLPNFQNMCNPMTGGTCFLGGSCDSSRSAECQNGMCVCPEYMCAVDGVCKIDPQKVSQAVGNGVQGVGEQITNIARSIPGVADSVDGIVGAVGGIGNTIGGVLGSITGANEGTCSGYVSTCVFSGCDSNLGFLVSCEYGSCQCKPGFCAVNGACQVDLQGLLSAGAQAASTYMR